MRVKHLNIYYEDDVTEEINENIALIEKDGNFILDINQSDVDSCYVSIIISYCSVIEAQRRGKY